MNKPQMFIFWEDKWKRLTSHKAGQRQNWKKEINTGNKIKDTKDIKIIKYNKSMPYET